MNGDYSTSDDPGFVINNPRLQYLFSVASLQCATLAEYAAASNMTTQYLLEILNPLIANRVLSLDVVHNEFFVNTRPYSNSSPGSPSQDYGKTLDLDRISRPHEPPPNLWRVILDRSRDVEVAYSLFKLIRNLEAGGWKVELDQQTMQTSHSLADPFLLLGVWIRGVGGSVCIPLTPFPAVESIGDILDLLVSRYPVPTGIALTCPPRALDSFATAIRCWFQLQSHYHPLTVFILEAPTFSATLINPSDTSVTPTVVQYYDYNPDD